MKVIFLDIDGVLNCSESKSQCFGYTGIDNIRMKRLRRIVEETGAKIILTSTWKEHWYKESFNKPLQDELADYLDRKLKRERLAVFDKTADISDSRSKGILQSLAKYSIEKFIIVDDQIFDYEEFKLMPYLIKTDYESGGLTDEITESIIQKLAK